MVFWAQKAIIDHSNVIASGQLLVASVTREARQMKGDFVEMMNPLVRGDHVVATVTVRSSASKSNKGILSHWALFCANEEISRKFFFNWKTQWQKIKDITYRSESFLVLKEIIQFDLNKIRFLNRKIIIWQK